MAYALDVVPRGTYLYISVTGENSVDTVSNYLAEVQEWCQRLNCANVLIVENLEGPSLTTSSVYGVVSKISNQPDRIAGKIAYVDLNPLHDAAVLKFGEDVAVNRGVSARVFATVSEAEAWLESQI